MSSEIERRDETPAFVGEQKHHLAGACSDLANPHCRFGRAPQASCGVRMRNLCLGKGAVAIDRDVDPSRFRNRPKVTTTRYRGGATPIGHVVLFRSVQALDRRVTYRTCRAYDVVAHWAKRGRPRQTSEPLEPSPLQLALGTTICD
jgi:hypothetical protein